jgi:hypothetical protein
MVIMSPELRQAIREAHGAPVQVVDPDTNECFVLLADTQFERMRDMIANDVAIGYEAFARVAGPHGWDDPEMDVYEEYRDLPNAE